MKNWGAPRRPRRIHVGRQSGVYAAALARKHEEERIQYDPTYVQAF
eukprot:COSAG01_NODE_67217_length_267_cov_2.095238_1_plen_45_part_01